MLSKLHQHSYEDDLFPHMYFVEMPLFEMAKNVRLSSVSEHNRYWEGPNHKCDIKQNRQLSHMSIASKLHKLAVNASPSSAEKMDLTFQRKFNRKAVYALCIQVQMNK